MVLMYCGVSLTFTIILAKQHGLSYLFSMPAVFFALHFSYGTGYIKGIWHFILHRKQNNKAVTDVPLTR
jgi:hypothetical protein